MKDLAFLRRASLPTHLVLVMAALLTPRSILAAEIGKLQAFATADSIRIELAPGGDGDFAGVEFHVVITQVKSGRPLWQGSLGQGAPGGAKTFSFTKTISRSEEHTSELQSPM